MNRPVRFSLLGSQTTAAIAAADVKALELDCQVVDMRLNNQPLLQESLPRLGGLEMRSRVSIDETWITARPPSSPGCPCREMAMRTDDPCSRNARRVAVASDRKPVSSSVGRPYRLVVDPTSYTVPTSVIREVESAQTVTPPIVTRVEGKILCNPVPSPPVGAPPTPNAT